MHVFTFFTKVGFYWIFPRDCTVELHSAGPHGESCEGIRVGSCHPMSRGSTWRH